MKSLTLHLQAATEYRRIEGVSAFSGEDASGRFAIRPGHERMLAVLVPGLARFRAGTDPWQYLALPGAVLYLVNDELFINTRRFLCGGDYRRISAELENQLLAEEKTLGRLKQSLHQLEEAMLQRLIEVGRRR